MKCGGVTARSSPAYLGDFPAASAPQSAYRYSSAEVSPFHMDNPPPLQRQRFMCPIFYGKGCPNSRKRRNVSNMVVGLAGKTADD